MNNSYNKFNPYIIASNILRIEDCPPPGTLYGQRVVRWYEIELMNISDGGYIITNDKKLYAKKGDIFIRKPGMVVQGVSAYGCDIIVFDTVYDNLLENKYNEPLYKSASKDFLDYYNNRGNSFNITNNLPEKITIQDYDYYKSLFYECFERYIKHQEDFQFHGKRIVFDLLYQITQEAKKQNTLIKNGNENNNQSIYTAKKYVEEHFSENITLKSLSKLAGYNADFFCRLFKKSIGESPINYLLNTRYVHAKRLLITTNYPIKKVSALCGFRNDTYFYTFFKRKENMSPREFRALNKYTSG